jgi:ketosteroid isomerase-like protein
VSAAPRLAAEKPSSSSFAGRCLVGNTATRDTRLTASRFTRLGMRASSVRPRRDQDRRTADTLDLLASSFAGSGDFVVGGIEHKQVVLDYFEALVADDWAGLAELFTNDVRWYPPPSAETEHGVAVPTIGRDAFLEMQRAGLETIYHPRAWDVRYTLEEGDLVATLVMLEAMTPSGHLYRNTYFFLFKFRGDVICEFWEFVDTIFVKQFLDSTAR